MSLSLIVGPPNSGRAGAVRERLEAGLGRDPVLVVPTLEDASRFEQELCTGASPPRSPFGGPPPGERRAILGVSILTFERLFEEVVRATGASTRAALTRAQRLHLVRRAIATTDLGVLARSGRRPGFARALEALIEELLGGGLDPATVEHAAAESAESSRYLTELAALYRAYVGLRDELGLGDSHAAAAEATAAVRAQPDSWGTRPVLFYGFDDMTVEQLELVAALGTVTDATVSVTFEDRAALGARARLRAELLERGGEIAERLEPEPANTSSELLFHLERGFLADGVEPAELDPGLVLMEAAGERGQAEQIGGEIARLIATGIDPDEIAVVLRQPDRHGPLYEEVLGGFGIPVAVEARIPLHRTAVGRGLLALLRAEFGPRSADDLLAFLRTPGRAWPDQADWLERAIRRRRLRTAAEAIEAWRGRSLFELDDLRDAGGASDLLRTIARLARNVAEHPYDRQAPQPERERLLELRAAGAAAAALEELAEIPGIEDGPGEAIACLEALEIDLWRGPSDGRVRVTSPYRIRAQRVRHLFVASLQEGEFPRHDPGEPLVSEDARAELGLPARAEPEDEERYLFYVCISRPTERLYLCWRSCDDEGATASPSPLLDDVRDLVATAPPASGERDPFEDAVRRRSLADVTVSPVDAPSADQLARSLAAAPRRDGIEVPEGLEISAELRESLRRRLECAAEMSAPRSRYPGPLQTPAVVEALAARQLFGASTLEEYALCSYRWFVDHELGPRRLDPDPDPLVQGSIIHRVLEELYRSPPGPDPVPRPGTVAVWKRRAGELAGKFAAESGLGGEDARSATSRARIEALVGGFLERESRATSSLAPDSELLEASFGEEEDDARPALDLGGFGIHGKIDRVDMAPGGRAGLVRDYKGSRRVTSGAKLLDEGKLQLQLYARTLSAQWGIDPLGSVYEPLGATDDARPRGILRKDERDAALDGFIAVDRDLLEPDDFESALDAAEARAAEIVAGMRAGRIRRDPIDDRCPSFCTFQAICRRERAVGPEPSVAAEEEGEEQ
jgi:ATP-dependent helicase/DNAse subunit B